MTYFVFIVLLIGCCGYALVEGGPPERLAAALQIVAFVVDDVVHRLVEHQGYATLALESWAIDITLLIALVILACRSTRFWPLYIAGWQGAAIIGHAAKFLDPAMRPFSYAFETQVWGYPMLVVTAIGAARHQQRLRSGDADWSWKSMYPA